MRYRVNGEVFRKLPKIEYYNSETREWESLRDNDESAIASVGGVNGAVANGIDQANDYTNDILKLILGGLIAANPDKGIMLFHGQSYGGWTITDQDGNELSSGVLSGHRDINTTTVLSNGNLFHGLDNGVWIITDQKGNEISTGILSNLSTIFTTTVLSNGNLYHGQAPYRGVDGDGNIIVGTNWTITDQDGNEISNGVYLINSIYGTSIYTTTVLSNGNLFHGCAGVWIITDQKGNELLSGVLSYYKDIYTTTVLSNGNLFHGQFNGFWTITDQSGNELSSGVLSGHRDINTTTVLSNGNLFHGQPSGGWTITDQDGNELSSGMSSNVSPIYTTILLNNGKLFHGQLNGNWTITDQDGNELSSGVLTNSDSFSTTTKVLIL